MQDSRYNFSVLSMDMPSEDRLRLNVLACGPTLGLEFHFSTAMQAKILFLPKNSAFTHIMLDKAKTHAAFSLIFVNPIKQDPTDELFFQGWPCISAQIDSHSLARVLKKHFQHYAFAAAKETELSQYNFFTLTDLVGHLYQLITKGQQYFSITNGKKTLFLNLEKNLFLLDSSKHYNFDQSNSSINKLLIHFQLGGSIDVLTKNSCNLATKKYQTSYLANRFLWFLGAQIKQQLIAEIETQNTFSMTHWPDFGSLKTDPDQLRICACLAQNPLTLHEIKDKLNLSQTKVIAFLNSSMLCQHLTYGTHLNLMPKNTVSALSCEEILNCRLSLNIAK